MDLKRYTSVWLPAFIFAVVYCLISIVNHANLLTYALDLGLYNNTIYSYAHGKANYSPLILPYVSARNQLADHFDLFLVIISPLFYLFGSYTLLIVQIAAVVAGGIAVNLFLRHYLKSNIIALLGQLHFYVIWGIYSALAFDYHSNVVAAMFIPWLFYAAVKNNKAGMFLATFLAIICKENIALYWLFVLLALALSFRKNKPVIITAIGLMAFSFLYFYLVMFLFIPALLPAGVAYIHFEYSVLGENFSEALHTVITKPLYVFNLLFIDPKGRDLTYGIKPELHASVMLSGGWAMFTNWPFALSGLVIYAQKLFHNDYAKWGIVGQYSIEFAPLITLSSFMFLKQFRHKLALIIAVFLIVSTVSVTIYSFYNPYSKWHAPQRVNLFKNEHYKRSFNTHLVIKLINQVPQHFKVSCSSQLAPHLSARDTIYQFPFSGNGADLYILLEQPDTYYPLDEERFANAISNLQADTLLELCYRQNNLIVFKRKDIDYCIK